ncbi:MAG: hypothetical protein ABJA78_19020, partial [Ferruginibacter sp.]
MKKLFACCAILFFVFTTSSQTAVNMSALPGYTYTENFADIDNWIFNNAPQDGTFTAGIGSAPWRGNATGGSGTIPNGTKITAATTLFQTPASTSGGVYRGTQSLVFLSTGTTDNTSAVAMDLSLNFSGLNAGTLSFDWASINNSSGNRKSSLRIYASTDGITFTEITNAAVLNFTNNAATAGSISYVTLPASFNNSATAKLRFYYHNGVGGTTGSRPKISIDNLKITAVPNTPCSNPTAQPVSFTAGTITVSSIQASFAAAAPAPDNYLVVMSVNNNLSSGPVDGSSYSIGDNLGDGTVISISSTTNFTATVLAPSTTYYFFIFSMNSLCTGGPLYNAVNPLQGTATTLSGTDPCTAPLNQPTSLTFSNITPYSIRGNFTATTADEYLIVRSTASSLSSNPVNATTYNAGDALGGGTVVTKTALTNFTANNLAPGVTYYFFVFAISSQSCTNGPAYNTTAALTASAATTNLPTCTTPSAQPTSLNLTADNTVVNGYFTVADADGYLVLYSTSSTLSNLPQNGVIYSVGNTIGNATVLENSTAASFIATNLTPGTNYYFYIFSKNNLCSGGPLYLTTNPLQGNTGTTLAIVSNFYFGNLHAHSSYSDGNKDNGQTPASDYAFAKNSLCMDFLGISEHNHAGAGMNISSWQPGITQAAAATTATFLALYGMEWGVISNGGHVLVYGIDKLLGWESGNYDFYVAKSDYTGTPATTGTTGLFRFINNWGNNAFATLAHPTFSDYNNLSNSPFNATADSAMVGSALESGPAFSTNITYTDPPSRLNYLLYFNTLLSRGYHIGPLMDHDNHYTTFGRTSFNRLAVNAPALNSAALLSAMRNRHFYATQDCDTRVSFTINNQPMGSIITGSDLPSISVYATDPTNAAAVPKIRIMYGVPGSNVLPAPLDSTNAKVFNVTDYYLTNTSTAYYYAEVTIGGAKVITSPIWYTRISGTIPVKLLSFNAAVTPDRFVKLDWSTASEYNNRWFVIERSADGVNFTAIDSVAGKMNYALRSDYSVLDKHPFDGSNYYRLKQVDADGHFTYSKVLYVNLRKAAVNYLSIYPDPA